jgi:hypothetical protein
MPQPELLIAQGMLVADTRGVRVVAQSDSFETAEAERIAVLFGTRPPSLPCPLAHFCCRFGKNHVTVTTVADQPDESLAFRMLIVDRELYRHLGDPFAMADRFPVNWSAKGLLPCLEWPPEPLARRRVENLQDVLKTGDSPLLLGSAQILVDGGRVLLQRSAPDESFFRGLWQLLPDRNRAELWVASLAFSDELGFHAAALPALPPDPDRVRHTEESLRDYPQSRYELNLQIAIEAGDQKEVDHLFARRTSNETIRLGLTIIALALVAAAIFKFVL